MMHNTSQSGNSVNTAIKVALIAICIRNIAHIFERFVISLIYIDISFDTVILCLEILLSLACKRCCCLCLATIAAVIVRECSQTPILYKRSFKACIQLRVIAPEFCEYSTICNETHLLRKGACLHRNNDNDLITIF